MSVPMTDLVNQLRHVHWSPGSDTSVLLSNLDIEHGFWGKHPPSSPQNLSAHFLTQVHGKEIIAASPGTRFDTFNRLEADGLFTTNGDIIAVKTADCLPVLMASSHGSFVAAVHAGWRGLTAGILLEALNVSRSHKAAESLRVIIGPAISRQAFEVGPEVVDALRSSAAGLSGDSWALALSKGRRDRWHIDLQTAAATQMILSGVDPRHIEVIQGCTFTDQTSDGFTWNSYRREGRGCGSNWSWIRGK